MDRTEDVRPLRRMTSRERAHSQSDPLSPQPPSPPSMHEDDEHRPASPLTGGNTFIFPIRSVYGNRNAAAPAPSGVASGTQYAASTSPGMGRGIELGRTPSGDEDTDPMSIPGAMMDMLESGSRGGASSPKSSAKLSRRSSHRTPPLSPDERDELELPLHGRTTLEPDDRGITNLVNDFSGIIRLGDAQRGDGTVEGSLTALPPVTPVAPEPNKLHGPGQASIGGLLREGAQTTSASMRAQTRDSVRNFVNEQAHTVQIADPNAATPSPGPEQGDVSSGKSSVPSSSESASTSSLSNLRRPQPVSAKRWVAFNDTSSESVWDSPSDASSPAMFLDEGVPAEESATTSRFQHLTTEEGHHVVVGREGVLQRCEDEPITIPGAVQSFGVLILLEEDYDMGDMTVRQVSEVSRPNTSPDRRTRPSCWACHRSTSSA